MNFYQELHQMQATSHQRKQASFTHLDADLKFAKEKVNAENPEII